MEFEKIRDIIAEVLKIDKKEVLPEASLVDDLGVDSMNLLRIILRLEEEFKINISQAEAAGMVTVQDVANRIGRP